MNILWRLSILTARQIVDALTVARLRTKGRKQLTDVDADIEKLQRVLVCVRRFNNLHPHYARHEYGNLTGYLQRHLSEDEWLLFHSASQKHPRLNAAFTGQGRWFSRATQ